MKKLAFVGNGEPPSKLLEIFKKLTPGESGVWGELQGIDNYEDADYFMVIDCIPQGLRKQVDETKCVFLGAHPKSLHGYRDMSTYKGIAMFDADKRVGFIESWNNCTYDYLKALQPPKKTKKLICIMSDSASDISHTIRRNWLKKFTDKISTMPEIDFELWGRINPFTPNMKKYYKGTCGSYDPRGASASGGNDHMSGKEPVLMEAKYVLDFDNISKSGAYFSERIFDDITLWAMPIYYNGGGMLHTYIGENSFRYLNIDGDGSDVIEIINSSFYEDNIESLAKARQILLDELQLWPRTHMGIFGRCK